MKVRITADMIRLQVIIDKNTESAESGCHQAQAQIVQAEEELSDLLLVAIHPQPKRDEQFESDMLDLAGTSNPYAPARPSNYN